MEYRPDFTLTAEGKDITAAIRHGLVSIRLTDYGGATGKTDTLEITLVSETLRLPPGGARLQLGLGFNDEIVDKGHYVVCSAESSGPPRIITISATAAPANSRKQPADTTAHKDRVFENTTLGDVVKTIAKESNLTPRVTSRLASISIKHEIQHGESDGAFMLRLARRYNAVSKPAGGYWLFLEQGAAELASGKPVASWTFLPEDVNRWSYKEGERGGAKTGEKKGKVGVDYFNPATGKTETHTQEHDGADAQHPFTHADKESAQHSAKSAVTQAGKNGRQMSLSGPVRPALIRMTAECQFSTLGFGEREDFHWQAESIQFSLDEGGFSFDISLKTDITAKGKKKEKGKGVDYGVGSGRR